MSRDALPCIVCGSKLENIMDDSDNQADDGLAFQSYGHYGSTSFDPMDGSYIEINICDPCIIQAYLRNEILWGRNKLPILRDGELTGFQTIPHRPLVPWNGDGGGDFDVDVIHES